VFIAFFGETFKMCANVFYILMNVNRYMLIGREHNSLLQKISKWEFNWVAGVSLSVSVMINIGHIFQYTLNEGSTYAIGGESLYLNSSYPGSLYSMPEYIYLLVYFLINYFGFFVANTGVEVTLVRKLHSELKDKKERMDKMTAASITNSFRQIRKKEIEERTEQRALIMVAINALITFFF
jgi:hypothetical protein